MYVSAGTFAGAGWGWGGGHVFNISCRYLSSVLGVAVLRLIHVSCGRVRLLFVVFDDDLFLCTESVFNVYFFLPLCIVLW